MRAVSISSSKWFCQTMALWALTVTVTVTLIGNSLALKCEKCSIRRTCTEKECEIDPFYAKLELDTTAFCMAALVEKVNETLTLSYRDCAFMNDWTNLTEGNNKCKEMPFTEFKDFGNDLKLKLNATKEDALASGKVTLPEIMEFDERQKQRDASDDQNQRITICVCNSNNWCNSDEGIKELKKGKGEASTGLGSGNHVIVIFLALAVQICGLLVSQ